MINNKNVQTTGYRVTVGSLGKNNLSEYQSYELLKIAF